MELDDRAFSWYSTELGEWYAAAGEYEILIGASSRDLRLSTSVRYETERRLPVHITLNTTVGELMEHDNTRPLACLITKKMDAFFGVGNDNSETGKEAINDEMANAIVASQPLRGVISFGIMSPEEMRAEIAKYSD